MHLIVLLPFLLASAVSDCRARRIPNRLLLAACICSILAHLFRPLRPEPKALCWSAVLLLFLFLSYRKGKLGGGDIKLFALIALALPDRRGFLIPALCFLMGYCVQLFLKTMRGGTEQPLPIGLFAFPAALLTFFLSL